MLRVVIEVGGDVKEFLSCTPFSLHYIGSISQKIENNKMPVIRGHKCQSTPAHENYAPVFAVV